MLRWYTGSFVLSKASICGILNFAGRGNCSTPAVNGDSVCCTRASMKNRAQPFTTFFMWLSSCWMPWNRCSQDCSPIPLLIRGWLITSVVPVRHPLIETISEGYVWIIPPSLAIFSSSVNVSRGAEVLLFLLWSGIAAFTGLLCLLWALHLFGEFRQLP